MRLLSMTAISTGQNDEVFCRHGGIYALTDADDENHKPAVAFYRNAKEKGTRFVTTNFVVCETMNYLRARISHNIAVLFRENLKDRKSVV